MCRSVRGGRAADGGRAPVGIYSSRTTSACLSCFVQAGTASTTGQAKPTGAWPKRKYIARRGNASSRTGTLCVAACCTTSTSPNVRSFWRPVQCQSGRRQWAGSEQAADERPIHLEVLTECTHRGVSTGKSQLGDASQSSSRGLRRQVWSSHGAPPTPSQRPTPLAPLAFQQVRARRCLPFRQQPRVVCHGPPTHRPASQPISPQRPRVLEVPEGPWQENPRGAAGVAKGEGGTLPALSQGPFVSPSRANLRAPIVRTARRSAGVAVRNRMTWVFFQRLCVRVFVAHGREDAPLLRTHVRIPSRPHTTSDWRPGGSVRLGHRGPSVTYKELPRSSRSHLKDVPPFTVHRGHWCRTAPSRSGAAWPTGHCPWQKLDRRQLARWGIHSVGGGDLCDLLACWPRALLR